VNTTVDLVIDKSRSTLDDVLDGPPNSVVVTHALHATAVGCSLHDARISRGR